MRIIPETNIKELRKRLGLTQKEFAKKYHLSLTSVRNWEQNIRTPQGPIKILLFLIENMSKDIENALKKLEKNTL